MSDVKIGAGLLGGLQLEADVEFPADDPPEIEQQPVDSEGGEL